MERKNERTRPENTSEKQPTDDRSVPSTSRWTDRLYALFMQAPAMIAVLKGPDHVFELANSGYTQLVGGDRNIIGKPVRKALAEIEGQGFFELLDQVYQTGETYTGYEQPVHIDREGNGRTEEVFVNFIYQPTRDDAGNVDGIFVHVVDVTEQVRSRQHIEESESKYRSLFNSVDQGFCIFEMIFDGNGNPVDYRFIETNQVFEDQTGLKNAIGKTARELVPSLEDHWFKIYGKVALTGEPEKFIEGSDAMGRWFEVFAFPVGKRPSKVALLFTDITKRKQEEDVRTKVMAELEERVIDRTKDLNSANMALQRSNDDLLQFAHVASHDLKEPVRKILTFADLLRADEDSRLSPRGTAYLNKIQHASQRMVSMIEGVLRYSSLDSYGQTKEPIQLADVLGSIETDLEVLIRNKNATIRYDNTFPVFEGAPILVFQLFYNLLNNSLKFSRPNVAPEIFITGKNEHINGKDCALISVRDNGVGFDQAYADRIFTTFTRLHSKDIYEGTGLGLALCKKIVNRHNGEIRANSTLNKGATFTIQLPIRQEKPLI